MEILPLITAAASSAGSAAPNSVLDKLLNIIVPLAVFIALGFMIYQNFTYEIDALIRWIKKQFAEKPQTESVPLNNPYISDGNIVYR